MTKPRRINELIGMDYRRAVRVIEANGFVCRVRDWRSERLVERAKEALGKPIVEVFVREGVVTRTKGL